MSFCKKCGQQVSDTINVCPNCGNPTNTASNANVQPTAQDTSSKKSSWNGSVGDTLINSLVASLIMSVTCYIATPWAICYIVRFIVDNAVINGKTYYFDGDGGQLFGQWIKWLLLTVVTCGIYSFWVTPKLYNWIFEHIHEKN